MPSRRQLEQQRRDEENAQSAKRRRLLRWIGWGTAATVLSSAGVYSWLNRDEPLPPKLDPNSIKIDANTTVESLLYELVVKRRYKKVFFVDNGHDDVENHDFFSGKAAQAFRKVIPQNEQAYVASEISKLSGTRLMQQIRQAATEHEQRLLVENYYRGTGREIIAKKRGMYDTFITARLNYIKAIMGPGFVPLPVDTENDNNQDPDRGRLANVAFKVSALQLAGQTGTPEHTKALEEYYYYGQIRVNKVNPIWVQEIKDNCPKGYCTSFVGRAHIRGEKGIERAFNAPVIVLQMKLGKIGPDKIITANPAEADFIIEITDQKALAAYKQQAADLLSIYSSNNPDSLGQLAQIIHQTLIKYNSYGFTEQFADVANNKLIPWLEAILRCPTYDTAKDAVNNSSAIITAEFYKLFTAEQVKDDINLSIAAAALNYLTVKASEITPNTNRLNELHNGPRSLRGF